MDVYYPGIVAGDAATIGTDGTVSAIVTPNATYQVYELEDKTFSTPLTIKTPSGLTDTKVPVGNLPIFPDVYVVSPNYSHNWKSGDLVFRRDSDDAKDKAVATAVAAAQAAVSAVPVKIQEAVASGNFRGAPGTPGRDGSNVVPTAQAIATELTTKGSLANTALGASFVGAGAIFIDLLNCGPVGTADDSPTWAEAIRRASAAAAGGNAGTILMPKGTTTVTGLDLPSKVGIFGHGRQSRIKLKVGSNRPVIRTADPTTQALSLKAFTIDGNKSQQGVAAESHGIWLNNQAAAIPDPFEQFMNDSCHTVEDVFITSCLGDGFRSGGRGENKIRNVFSFFNNGDGFRVDSFDTWLGDCSAGNNLGMGFNVTMPNVALTSCKGFMNKRGLHMEGTHVMGCTVSNFVAQGNYEHGISLVKVRDNFVQGVSFDNNYGEIPNSLWCGIYMSASLRNTIVINSYRHEKPTAQVAALYLTDSSLGNNVYATTDSTLPLYLNGSNTRGNSIKTPSTDALVVIPFAVAWSPNAKTAEVFQMSLTGNLVINAPLSHKLEGQRIKFIFRQDAVGGRTVTWGAGWPTKDTNPALVSKLVDPAPNSTSVIEATYWDNNWFHHS